jgi:acyl-CoA synthetase (AMP-forming)/AMP-acid ligase II
MGKIVGRSDDMLIIRGVNVFPTQIEEIVLQTRSSPASTSWWCAAMATWTRWRCAASCSPKPRPPRVRRGGRLGAAPHQDADRHQHHRRGAAARRHRAHAHRQGARRVFDERAKAR